MCKRMKLEIKWTKDLNERPETIKLIEENIVSTLFDVNHSKILSDPPPRLMEKKKNRWGLCLKLKFLTQQRKHKQDESTTLGMRENNCK